jgi:hypothetical protein
MSINFLQKLAKYDGVAFIKEAIGATTTGAPMQPGSVQMSSEEGGRQAATPPSAGKYNPTLGYRGSQGGAPGWINATFTGGMDNGVYYGIGNARGAAPGDPLGGNEDSEAKERARQNLLKAAANQNGVDQEKIRITQTPTFEEYFDPNNNIYHCKASCSTAAISIATESGGASPGKAGPGTSPGAPESPGGQFTPNAATPKKPGRTLGAIWKEKARRQKGQPFDALLTERYTQIERQKLDPATKEKLMVDARAFLKSLRDGTSPSTPSATSGNVIGRVNGVPIVSLSPVESQGLTNGTIDRSQIVHYKTFLSGGPNSPFGKPTSGQYVMLEGRKVGKVP